MTGPKNPPDTRRQRPLNDKPVLDDSSCVLYVMSRDQRVNDNHALALAQAQALELGVPMAVVFCLLPGSGQRAREHYQFMLDGLKEVEADLKTVHIPFMVLIGSAEERLKGVLHHLTPQAVYFDFSPLRGPRRLHQAIADAADCAVYEVDTHNIVPAWIVSDKQEYGARTLRPKLQRLLSDFVAAAPAVVEHPHRWPGTVQPMAALQDRIDKVLQSIPSNGSDTGIFQSGEAAARKALANFVRQRLPRYADKRNDPTADAQSDLSPYTHFGQLSAAAAVREALEAAGQDGELQTSVDAFVEEITIRKELSDNYCYYNADYDKLAGAPQWARQTLDKHAADDRSWLYDRQQLIQAQTHDQAWNAAQIQMMRTGKMHNYMRMYWAKKILEWSVSPHEAVENLRYLNDFYHLDGGDPGGYVGILWSVAGLHDRPWGERAVYGTVRSMVYNGLARKFDIKAYERRWTA